MIRFFLAFIVILAFLIFIWWLLRNRKIPWLRAPTGELKYVESLHLGMNISVHIIKYKDKRFLIGCTPNSIVLLKEIEDESCKE